MSRYIAIVDPYSSGRLLAERLHEKGVRCVAIKASLEIPPVFHKQAEFESFDHVLTDGRHLEQDLMRRYGGKLTHVVAGCESGVELADRLSENLALPSNGTALSPARRDKFKMAVTVRKYGLRTADVFQSSDPYELRTWAVSRDVWPLVVKPVSSVASDNVHLCKTGDDVCRSFAAIVGKTNVLGIVNDSVLAQEYIGGQEYVVDTVSLDGHHKVTAFWAYQSSRQGSNLAGYDAMKLLPYNGARQEALEHYAIGVLDALGIRFGPAHCEVMWWDGSPVLVEIGARLSAGLNAVLTEACGCISQLEETVKTLLYPEEFHDVSKDQRILEKYAANVFLHRRKLGRLRCIRHERELRQLKTLYRLSLSAATGELLPSVLGMVTLVHPDPHAIEKDIEKIRTLEEAGLFDVEEAE